MTKARSCRVSYTPPGWDGISVHTFDAGDFVSASRGDPGYPADHTTIILATATSVTVYELEATETPEEIQRRVSDIYPLGELLK